MFQRTARCVAGALVAVSMGSVALAGDWPQWRGPARDGIVGCFAAPKAWPEKLTKVWSIEVGAGAASPLVAGGKVYLHARQDRNETVSAFDLASGKLLWRDSYPASQGLSAPPPLDGGVLSTLGVDPILPAFDPAAGKNSPTWQAPQEGPYATPTLDGGVLYAFGINTVLSAYDPAVGKLLWRHDFAGELPTPRPDFGTTASPLVVDGMVVVQAGGGGKGAVVALDAKTGGFRWRLNGGGPGYGSPVAATFSGVRQVIVPTEKTILGAALATGEKLWEMPFPVPYSMLTPLVMGDIFVMSGQDTDTQAIRVSRKDGAWMTEKVWANRSISMATSSPVLADGLLCGFSSFRRGHVFCADPGTGEVRWKTEGGEGESGAVVAAGNHLFVLRSDAELQVIRKTGGEIRKVAQYTVADATTWATPVLLDGRILVKDAMRLTLWSL